jgi:hypothetical protein
MKILTITCHRPYNYGAVLQAYALQHYLESIGVETAVIDYYPDYQRSKTDVNLMVKIIWCLYRLPDFIVGKRVFGKFLKDNIRLTRQYKTLDELKSCPPKADGVIAGSDQIWNYNIHKDDTYYLTFVPENCFKAAYAASIAQDSIPKEMKPLYQRRLQGFKKIAVREKTAERLLTELGCENVTTVLDPVFLLSADEWTSNIADTTFEEKGYVLMYAFNCTKEIADYAIDYARKNKKKLYIINTMINDYRFRCDHHYWNCSPNIFVSLFKNADAVVTNSFHGLSFSIIFKKQVYVFSKHTGGNSRLFDMMQELNLSNCKDGVEIDYKEVYKVLNEKIKYSKSVITEILKLA